MVAVVLAVLLIHGLVLFVGQFMGTPLGWAIAWCKGNHVIMTEHKDTDYKVESMGRVLKSGQYVVNISSPTCVDEYFTLWMDKWGNIQTNTYEDRVASKVNTSIRVDAQYQEYIDGTGIWKTLNGLFTFRETPAGVEQHAAEIRRHGGDFDSLYVPHENSITMDDYVLNKVYSDEEIKQMGVTNGNLWLPLKSTDPSYAEIAEMLLKVKEVADEKGAYFYTVDVNVYDAALPSSSDPVIDIYAFRYEDIYEEGLEERVKEAHEAYNRRKAEIGVGEYL